MNKSWNFKKLDHFTEWFHHLNHHCAEIDMAIDDIKAIEEGEEPCLSVDPREYLIIEAKELIKAAEEFLGLEDQTLQGE